MTMTSTMTRRQFWERFAEQHDYELEHESPT